ncbi:hypothetical protein BLNAU_21027 [Blattamonas nauphoetae]|uniref:Uncharacterized protein n=1 Tax=Blattamonas nauphoetae TaxID=2049346 RepID=A0ABQ9WXJ3_9EUKA|nr:hypothetical protein BLNAU_21027 [Blattamonas nauphoetae]
MDASSDSVAHCSIHPFIRETPCDPLPLFQRVVPIAIDRIEQASPPFLSLVNFVKEGNHLDENAAEQAYTLLRNLAFKSGGQLHKFEILYKLVDSPNGSCSGFANSLVILLTSSDEELIQSTLFFMHAALFDQPSFVLFDFLETGIFATLPREFYEQDEDVLVNNRGDLMRIVARFMRCPSSSDSELICQERSVNLETLQTTFIDLFFRPIKPFLTVLWNNRREITISEASTGFSTLIASIVRNSQFLEEMTQFVLSSSVALAFTDALVLCEEHTTIRTLLDGVKQGYGTWDERTPSVLKREQRVLTKLHEEGILGYSTKPVQSTKLKCPEKSERESQ